MQPTIKNIQTKITDKMFPIYVRQKPTLNCHEKLENKKSRG